MGLAPYGEPKYVDLIYKDLIDLQGGRLLPAQPEVLQLPHRPDDDQRGVRRALRRPAAGAGERSSRRREMDLARSVQVVCEEIMLRMARTAHRKLTGLENLCLAGGVALNCVGNGRILREGPFKQIWIQPAAGDAGGALGVAQLIHHRLPGQQPRRSLPGRDSMKGLVPRPRVLARGDRDLPASRSAPSTSASPTRSCSTQVAGAPRRREDHRLVRRPHGVRPARARCRAASSAIRAARGCRPQMNLKIKFREGFRPFAPSVLRERVAGLLRARLRLALHAAGGAGQEGALHPDDG